MHEEMGPSLWGWLAYGVIAIAIIAGILYCLCIKLANQEHDANW